MGHQLLVPPIAPFKQKLDSPWLGPHGITNRIHQYQEYTTITHTHPQLISRYDRHTSDPVPKDHTSVVQHERCTCKTKDRTSTEIVTKPKTAQTPKCTRRRRPREHRNANEAEDRMSAKMHTKPKTARAPKCTRSRRPHKHQNTHEAEDRTSTKMHTKPKTARAPKCKRSRRPHDHQNARQTGV